MNDELTRIIGGIDVKNDSIIIGGAEIIVGENVQWMTRNKLLMFENEIKYDINVRRLIKIIGLKLPIETSDIKYYDIDPLPVLTNKTTETAIHQKAMRVLKERLKMDVNEVVEKLIVEYELREPFYMALYSTIRCLAYINKVNNPTSYRIKVNASLASKLAYRESLYFKFSTASNINSAKELFLHMLSIVEKDDESNREFKCPVLKRLHYPVFDKKEYERKNKIEANRLIENTSVKDHVFAILLMENTLTDYLDKVERYYVACAKNITSILDTFHKYYNIEIIL